MFSTILGTSSLITHLDIKMKSSKRQFSPYSLKNLWLSLIRLPNNIKCAFQNATHFNWQLLDVINQSHILILIYNARIEPIILKISFLHRFN